jgi:hypothetical protein
MPCAAPVTIATLLVPEALIVRSSRFSSLCGLSPHLVQGQRL